MIRILILAAFLFVPVSAYGQQAEVPAQATGESAAQPDTESPNIPKFLQFLFPSLRTADDDPTRTLQAPFATPEETTDEAPKLAQPEDTIPLDQPHRASADITEWVINTASDLMMFEDSDYKQKLEDTKRYFDEGGRGQYEAFLNDTKIIKVLESGKYEVRSYVSDAPLLLNEGAVSGRYRWLYEVPVMVSYLPRGSSTYKNLEPVNQSIVIRLQLGRSADAETDLRLQVERWSGKAKKMDKK